MKTLAILIGAALIGAGGFIGGLAYRAHRERAAASGGTTHTAKRRILYYVDPMHPAYKSNKPGVAPDCGMKLEPVYADDVRADPAGEPGLVNVSP